MTAQISEIMIYKGERQQMASLPLEDYWALGGQKPAFKFTSTALYRGYIGTWQVTKDRLYLVKLEAKLEDGEPMSLGDLFPGFPDRVFAHWVSGRVRLPQGKVLDYVHAGWASLYEADLFIEFKNGILVSEELKQNALEQER
jgi:hypothetical protein